MVFPNWSTDTTYSSILKARYTQQKLEMREEIRERERERESSSQDLSRVVLHGRGVEVEPLEVGSSRCLQRKRQPSSEGVG